MKCLSLWQPWASLLVHGVKRCETRSWDTKHTGPLLIHAAKKWDGVLQAACLDAPFRDLLKFAGVPATAFNWTASDAARQRKGWDLPLGAIIGTVELKECVPTHSVINRPGANIGFFEGWHQSVLARWLVINGIEHALGDYSTGRFAWVCKDAVAFAKPIPFRGAQGLFDVPDAVVREAA